MVTLTRTQLALVVVPLVALLSVAGSRLAGVGTSQGPSSVAPLAMARSDGAAGAEDAAPRLVVHVVGAVRRGVSSGCPRAPVSPMRSLGRAGRPRRPTSRRSTSLHRWSTANR